MRQRAARTSPLQNGQDARWRPDGGRGPRPREAAQPSRRDENLARAELSADERAEQLVRRREILREKGLVNGRGGNRGNQYTGGKVAKGQNEPLPTSFTKEAAAALGVSESTIKRQLRRGEEVIKAKSAAEAAAQGNAASRARERPQDASWGLPWAA